jgi:hypothetical protein
VESQKVLYFLSNNGDYTLTGTIADLTLSINGEIDADTVETDDYPSLHIFPNPATGLLTVQTKTIEETPKIL